MKILSNIYHHNQKYVWLCSYQINIVHMYYVMYRLVHAFTFAGILPRQYINFSNFAGIGTVGKWYIHKGNIVVIFLPSNDHQKIVSWPRHKFLFCILYNGMKLTKHGLSMIRIPSSWLYKRISLYFQD